jgi:hypothetical protein
MSETFKENQSLDFSKEYNEASLKQELEEYRLMQIRFMKEATERNPEDKERNDKEIEKIRNMPEEDMAFFDNIASRFRSTSPMWNPEEIKHVSPERQKIYEDSKEIIERNNYDPETLKQLHSPFPGEQISIIRNLYIELRRKGHSRVDILKLY